MHQNACIPFSSHNNIMDNSHGNVTDFSADTELTLRFPGDPMNRPACGERNSNNGWPPVRGRRKKEEEEEEDIILLVKVAVDGVPFLRKVDLGAFSTYEGLLRALLEMFSSNCFTNIPTTRVLIKEEMMMRNRVVVNGIEYIPTYEDKDGDWMLLGDVPWEMFKQSCKRIRLVKS